MSVFKPDILEETFLYGGSVRITFNPKTHKYTVYDGQEVVYPTSVTGIVGIVDKSGPLIGWAINQTVNFIRGALLTDGQFAESYSSTFLTQVLDQAKKAARQAKQEAADIGTMAHNWLEDYFASNFRENATLPAAPEKDEVRNCVNAALAWLHEHHVEIVGVEQRIYSRKHKYSGTTDMIAYVDGKLCILDWKSSKGLYPEYKFQTAAYVAAYEEETGNHVEGRWLVRLGKTDGVFEAHYYPRKTYKRDLKAFLSCLTIKNYLEAEL